MAAKKNSSSKSNGFKEFEMEGKNFNYSGRIYPDNKREAGKLTIYPISLCINGLITIKGCSYYETEKNCWIGGPQFKAGDDYKDYLYIDKANNEDMDKLAEVLSGIIEDWSVKPKCPYIDKCSTYGIGCKGLNWWCNQKGIGNPDEDFMTINESLEMPF